MENAIPLEIERKYLIRLPDEGLLDQLALGRDWIEQTYLLAEAGTTERVRSRRSPGGTPVYTHTVKKRRSAVTREELESEIGQAEYEALLRRADPTLRVICKTRWRIPYEGHILEVDRFPFWADRAILEVELGSEAEPVALPDWAGLIREVTEDEAYTNRAMAASIPYEPLPGQIFSGGADPMKRSWAEIDLRNIEHNYRTLKARLPEETICLGVVKADSYGHGALPVARRLQALGCGYLAVATPDEAAQLREGDIRLPILILGPGSPECAAELADLGVTQAVGNLAQARALSAALRPGQTLKVHAKLETGMGRTGFPTDEEGIGGQLVLTAESGVMSSVGTFALKFLLMQSICAILLLVSSSLRNKSLGTVLAVLLGTGLLSLVYLGIDAGLAKLLPNIDFSISEYMPDQLLSASKPAALDSILSSAATIAVFLPLAIRIFDKKDVK